MVPKSRCSPDAGPVRGGPDRGLVESMLDVGELLDVCADWQPSYWDQMLMASAALVPSESRCASLASPEWND